MRNKPAKRGTEKDASKLRKLRQKLGMNQRQFAEEIYVSVGTVALWEGKKRSIPGPVLKLMEFYSNKVMS